MTAIFADASQRVGLYFGVESLSESTVSTRVELSWHPRRDLPQSWHPCRDLPQSAALEIPSIVIVLILLLVYKYVNQTLFFGLSTINTGQFTA